MEHRRDLMPHLPNCENCPRHINQLQAVAEMLTEDHRDSLQVALCDDHEDGACPNDPWSE